MFQRTVLFALACLGAAAASARADVITDWNEKAVAFVTPKMPPPPAHRVTAMVHVAMFDAVNSIERRYRPFSLNFRPHQPPRGKPLPPQRREPS